MSRPFSHPRRRRLPALLGRTGLGATALKALALALIMLALATLARPAAFVW
jgi:hypothetical protein